MRAFDLTVSGSLILSGSMKNQDGNSIVSNSAQIGNNISGSLGANAAVIRTLDRTTLSGSLGANAAVIRTLDRTTLSGSLGANAAVIRSLNRTTISGSIPQALATNSSPTFAAGTITGDFSVGGTLTAQEVHTEFESASILFTSGSTRFGDDTTDTHRVTGSMDISGSLKLPHGDVTITDNLSVDGTSNLDNTDIDGTLTVDGGNIVFNEDSADQDFRVESNGNANMLFVDGGNSRVGIGESPSYRLDVQDTADPAQIRLKQSGNTNGLFIKNFNGNESQIDNLDNGPIVFKTNDNEVVRFTATGTVGIGTHTPRDGKLHIHNGSSGAVSYVQLTQDGTGAASGDGLLVGVNAAEASIIYNAEDTPLIFYTDKNERVRIDNNGLVGIGTNSPDQQLHLYSTSANSPNILIQNENDSAGEAGAAGGIEFYLKDDNGSNPDFQDLGIIRWTGHDKDNPYNKFTAAAITGSSDDPGNSSGRIDFGVAYSDSMINAMTIRAASSGVSRVGIGTSNPVTKFVVSSSNATDSNGVAQIHQAAGTNHPTLLIKQNVQGGNNNDDQGLVIRVKGTSTGLGNSLHVYNRDDSNTGLVVKGNGATSLGAEELINRVGQPLAVTSGGGSDRGGIAINSFLADTNGPLVDFNRSRNNTIGSHTSVNSGDGLGAFIFRGSDGDEYVDSAAIVAEVDGSPGNNDMPGRMMFFTTPDGTNSLVERMRITNAGRVGINTTAPEALLHVSGSQGSGHVALFQRKEGANNTSYMVNIENDDTTSNQGAGLQVRAGNDNGDVTFNAVTRDGTFGLRVIGDGRVGIGCSDPESRLQVNPGVSDATIGAIDVGYGIEFNGGDGGHVGMGVIDGTSGRGMNRGFIGFRGAGTGGSGISHIVFGTSASSGNAPIERMRITTSGQVGIGCSPNYRFKVEGSEATWLQNISNTASSGNAFCQQLQFTGVSPNNVTSKFQQFVDGGSTVRFEVRSNGGVASFQSNDADLSDESVKKDIVDASNCLDTINNIKVRNFKYKDQTDDRTLIGVIAQEVEAVNSSLVDDSEDLKRVYNKDIMFMMLKSIQELTKRIEELEK